MRCNNCGWNNPEGLTKCEKCNSPLVDGNNNSANVHHNPSSYPGGTARESVDTPALNKTVRESELFGPKQPENNESPSVCPECGYQLRSNVSVCPYCHHDLSADRHTVNEHNKQPQVPPASFSGTVRPQFNVGVSCGFTLTPIENQGESRTPAAVSFDEKHIELNRANLEPANRTITSKVQAVIDFDEARRKWTIHDKSAQQYTFVRCSDPMTLVDGDIVLMGDRKFEFRTLNHNSASGAETPLSGTIVMGRQQANVAVCKFIPLPYPGDTVAPKECVVEGTSTRLNRALLDDGNYTITSKVQAVLTLNDGAWQIVDSSSLQTTYKLCSTPIDLKNGSVILMGNRNFIFNL